jgi:hypothetical protein
MFIKNRVVRSIINPGAPALHRIEASLKAGECLDLLEGLATNSTEMHWTARFLGPHTTDIRTGASYPGPLAGKVCATTAPVTVCIEVCFHSKNTLKNLDKVISTVIANGTAYTAESIVGEDEFCRLSCSPQALDAEKAKQSLMCMDPDCAEQFMDMLNCGFNWSMLAYLPELVDDLIVRKAKDCVRP